MRHIVTVAPDTTRVSQAASRIALPLLRLLAAMLGELSVPLRVVAPTYLDPCSACDEDRDGWPVQAVATVVYRLRGVTYREPVCAVHVDEVARWWTRHGAAVQAVELPAPVDAAAVA